MLESPVDDDFRDARTDALQETISHGAEPVSLLVDLFGRNLGRDAEACDSGDVERARTQAALVAPTVKDGFDRHRRSDEQRADALRPTGLVRRERGEIDTPRVEIDGNVAKSLDRVGMDERLRIGSMDQ